MIALSGKVAMVTGGSLGIGFACARRLAQAGAEVAIVARDREKAARAARELGRKVISLKMDVSDELSVNEGVSQIMEQLGSIDILVNNAGITADGLLMKMKRENWQKVLDINLTGTFLCTKAVIRPMSKAGQGRIINISSIVGATGNPGQANYAASKAGIIGLTKTTALEYVKKGITVNAIAPGFIETDMTGSLSEKIKNTMLEKIPQGRFGRPEEVADGVLFLASDLASYITGQVLHINGGMFLH
ncbi:MAG: 3-oxoacyl-[acyl-carrier-protein] reductase [bacterium]